MNAERGRGIRAWFEDRVEEQFEQRVPGEPASVMGDRWGSAPNARRRPPPRPDVPAPTVVAVTAPEDVRMEVPAEVGGPGPAHRPAAKGAAPGARSRRRGQSSRQLLRQALSSPAAARQAFLLREVLGSPVSLRTDAGDRPS
ncbi:MAG: hypothetical protein ACFCVK_20740 [Acidimicrobiales bacterium]